jgi:hypothetical protein
MRHGCLEWAVLLVLLPSALSAAPPAPPESRAPPPHPLLAVLPPQDAADWHTRHGLYFKRNWGVEILGVRPTAGGQMLVFRYRIVEPEKARILHEHSHKAYLIDAATGTRLAVPALENIGELRSGTEPQPDRSYFMIFGNPGRLVKSGGRVTLVVGDFQADDLVVE